MNPYLSHAEKDSLVRLIIMLEVTEDIINVYENVKSADSDFKSNLKRARTFVKKSIEKRLSFLSQEAKDGLLKSTAKIEVMFLAKLEAKKANDELLKMKSYLPMHVDDFCDWYSFVIETTCKLCARKDYENCPARHVLIKYEVFPADPEATNKCQYSYANNSAMALELSNDIDTIPEPEIISSANTAVNTLEEETAVDEEQIYPEEISVSDQNLLPVILGLVNGNKLELDLPENMAVNLLEEMCRPNSYARATCGRYLDGELVVIDMREVAVMTITGLEDGVWERPQNSFAPKLQSPLSSAQKQSFSEDYERVRYRVECKCGSEYFCSMNIGREKARCRDCKSTVFADYQADKVIDSLDGAEAVLLTNKYWVEREEKETPSIPPCTKKYVEDYIDPFNPLD